jgi:putative transposase
MSESKAEYYLHFVWTTQQRTPLLTPDIEASVFRCIQAETKRLRCVVLALDGMPDHVHLAVKAVTSVSPMQMMQQIKGISSKFIGDEFVHAAEPVLDWFQWQEGYGVFTFSASQKSRVVHYIQNQKQHHATQSLWSTCEPNA